mgnify:CR=1 FL=1
MSNIKKRKTYPCYEFYNVLVCDVDFSRGAPNDIHIRVNIGDKRNAKNKKIYCRRVPLPIDGAYDKGGAYWGIGAPLYVEFTLDKTYVKFFRKE